MCFQSVIVWLWPATKEPHGHPSPRWGTEEHGKTTGKNWWVGIRAV